MKTKNTNYIYKNDLDKACFQQDMAYGKYKDLAKRTQSDKLLRDKAFEIASNPQYHGCHRGLVSMAFEYFDKKQKAVVLLRLQVNLLLNPCQINNL